MPPPTPHDLGLSSNPDLSREAIGIAEPTPPRPWLGQRPGPVLPADNGRQALHWRVNRSPNLKPEGGDMTTPDAYWEEAQAAFHHCAERDAQIWAEPEPEPDHPLGVCGGQPVMEGHHGRLVCDCEPQTLDGGLMEPDVYGPETARDYVATLVADAERAREAREAEADLGHDYEGREAQPGTPEYEATYAEYLQWAATDAPEPEARAEAELELELELGR